MDTKKDTPLAGTDTQENTDITETEASTVPNTEEELTDDTASAVQETADTAEGSPEIGADSPETAAGENEAPAFPLDMPPEKSGLNGKMLSKIILFVTSLVLFIGTVTTTMYYILCISKTEFHADCTDTIMWANASIESGHLYDRDFSYACFLPFSTSTLMIPLIKIFGFGMTAHTLGMIGFFILLTLFMILMIREITESFNAALCGTSLLLAITHATPKMREIFWGHTIYYSLGILFLVIGAYLYARLLSLNSKQIRRRKEGAETKGIFIHRIFVFICLCVFLFLTGMDGISGITLFVIPLVGAIFAEQFLNTKYKLFSTKTTAVICRALVFLFFAFAGNKFNTRLLGGLVQTYADSYSEFSEINSWIEHLHMLPMAWMRLLGVKNLPDVMFTTNEGIYNISSIMASLLLAALPIVATLCYKKYGSDKKGRMMRIWVWIHWAVTAVVLMGYICGILATADWRLTPMIGTSIILSILFVFWAVTGNESVARISTLLVVPIFIAGYLNCVTIMKMPKDGYKTNNQYILVDFLEKQGVEYGYSTFWNANSITLLTDGRIKIRDVSVEADGIHHRRYQSADRWYKDSPERKEYFLLLSESECDNFRSSEQYQKDKPIRSESVNVNSFTYTLMIYDHNFVLD
ncbi:MAG: hypothetical protein K6G33_02600 [Ruminococcus sp.]|uniref:hypothetical protein n=1 Tax=Ruminococcus sp. TaxID=41978 RepID=UPI0025F7A6DB|nr:hypothetical protein [Ruminococcus sp.]MCR5599618.1 hypothetical protein [Ruminococcus sp.]